MIFDIPHLHVGEERISIRVGKIKIRSVLLATWLYQMTVEWYPQNDYRLEVWEGKHTTWNEQGKKRVPSEPHPEPGDSLLLFFAKDSCEKPGFHGWAVVSKWTDGERMTLTPVAPSDQLKMHPWGDTIAMNLADEVRGSPRRATFWLVDPQIARKIEAGIMSWPYRVAHPESRK
jgi:hypothetical protein